MTSERHGNVILVESCILLHSDVFRERLYSELERKCPDGAKRKWLPDPFLIQAVCLAHDLGHPPFGHGGERSLNRCMLQYGGFEGNGQTLRIITKIDNYTAGYGMDLTRRVVLGTIKYPAHHDGVENESVYPKERQSLFGKPIFKASQFTPPKCYLNEEHEDIVLGWVAEGLGDDDKWDEFSKVTPRPPKNGRQRHKGTHHMSFDASIMEVADDIAYGVYDLEDGIALKLIDKESFEKWLAECDREDRLEPLLVDKRLGPDVRSLAIKLFSDDTHERKQAIGHIVGLLVEAVEITKESEFLHPLLRYRVNLGCNMRSALDVLKNIVSELVINRLEVQQLEFKGQKIVTELFHAFNTDHERLLELGERKRIAGGEKKERVICDYIAGMTDDYAITRYRQLFVPRAGSVFDRL